jgi:uncharacterized protein YbjT (DUF2867 family)
MNIFLTGASGFIGGTVALRLKASGHRIRGLVRSSEKAARLQARAGGLLPDFSRFRLMYQPNRTFPTRSSRAAFCGIG